MEICYQENTRECHGLTIKVSLCLFPASLDLTQSWLGSMPLAQALRLDNAFAAFNTAITTLVLQLPTMCTALLGAAWRRRAFCRRRRGVHRRWRHRAWSCTLWLGGLRLGCHSIGHPSNLRRHSIHVNWEGRETRILKSTDWLNSAQSKSQLLSTPRS
jgi:hypothetical protein